MKNQTCATCGRTKPLEKFPQDARFKTGHGRTCYDCAQAAREALQAPIDPRPGKHTGQLNSDRLTQLNARADAVIEKTLEASGGPARYDVLLPIVRKMRDRLGRSGIGQAVDLFIDEGIFEEEERRAAEVAFRRRLRPGSRSE